MKHLLRLELTLGKTPVWVKSKFLLWGEVEAEVALHTEQVEVVEVFSIALLLPFLEMFQLPSVLVVLEKPAVLHHRGLLPVQITEKTAAIPLLEVLLLLGVVAVVVTPAGEQTTQAAETEEVEVEEPMRLVVVPAFSLLLLMAATEATVFKAALMNTPAVEVVPQRKATQTATDTAEMGCILATASETSLVKTAGLAEEAVVLDTTTPTYRPEEPAEEVTVLPKQAK